MKKFWIFIAIVLVLGAIPALYPRLWLDQNTWSLASDTLYEQNLQTLRERLGHAVQPALLEQIATCVTQRTVEWLNQSGCPYFAESLEEKAICIEDAGLRAASKDIQLHCAQLHSPQQWAPYRPLFISDAKRILANAAAVSTSRATLVDCIADTLVASFDASTCRPMALFKGNAGCFNEERRRGELAAAMAHCQASSE